MWLLVGLGNPGARYAAPPGNRARWEGPGWGALPRPAGAGPAPLLAAIADAAPLLAAPDGAASPTRAAPHPNPPRSGRERAPPAEAPPAKAPPAKPAPE